MIPPAWVFIHDRYPTLTVMVRNAFHPSYKSVAVEKSRFRSKLKLMRRLITTFDVEQREFGFFITVSSNEAQHILI